MTKNQIFKLLEKKPRNWESGEIAAVIAYTSHIIDALKIVDITRDPANAYYYALDILTVRWARNCPPRVRPEDWKSTEISNVIDHLIILLGALKKAILR